MAQRSRLRRSVQSVVGIIRGSHPDESASAEEQEFYSSMSSSSRDSTYRNSTSSSSSFGTAAPVFPRRRRNSAYVRSKASFRSLASINESDEDEQASLISRPRTHRSTHSSSASSSANVSVFDSDSSDDCDDDSDDDGFEDTDSSLSDSDSDFGDNRSRKRQSKGKSRLSNPFSDYYASKTQAATTAAAAAAATATAMTVAAAAGDGAELTRVNARSENPTPVQKKRANNPYNTHLSLDGTSSTAAAAANAAAAKPRVRRVSLPKGMKLKSTPGAYYGFTTTTTSAAERRTSRVAVISNRASVRNSGLSTMSSSSSSSAHLRPARRHTAPAATTTTANPTPKIIEIPWDHTRHGAYQTMRPAEPRAVKNWAIAAGGFDAGTMMAMMECPTPACDILLTPSASGGMSSDSTSRRLAEFDGLGGLGCAAGGYAGGLGEADMQWLEYMSIPSGSLGKATRWIGRRLGLSSSSSSSSASASLSCASAATTTTATTSGGMASARGTVGSDGGLRVKSCLMKSAAEGTKGGVVAQLAAPGVAMVKIVNSKRVRFE